MDYLTRKYIDNLKYNYRISTGIKKLRETMCRNVIRGLVWKVNDIVMTKKRNCLLERVVELIQVKIDCVNEDTYNVIKKYSEDLKAYAIEQERQKKLEKLRQDKIDNHRRINAIRNIKSKIRNYSKLNKIKKQNSHLQIIFKLLQHKIDNINKDTYHSIIDYSKYLKANEIEQAENQKRAEQEKQEKHNEELRFQNIDNHKRVNAINKIVNKIKEYRKQKLSESTGVYELIHSSPVPKYLEDLDESCIKKNSVIDLDFSRNYNADSNIKLDIDDDDDIINNDDTNENNLDKSLSILGILNTSANNKDKEKINEVTKINNIPIQVKTNVSSNIPINRVNSKGKADKTDRDKQVVKKKVIPLPQNVKKNEYAQKLRETSKERKSLVDDSKNNLSNINNLKRTTSSIEKIKVRTSSIDKGSLIPKPNNTNNKPRNTISIEKKLKEVIIPIANITPITPATPVIQHDTPKRRMSKDRLLTSSNMNSNNNNSTRLDTSVIEKEKTPWNDRVVIETDHKPSKIYYRERKNSIDHSDTTNITTNITNNQTNNQTNPPQKKIKRMNSSKALLDTSETQNDVFFRLHHSSCGGCENCPKHRRRMEKLNNFKEIKVLKQQISKSIIEQEHIIKNEINNSKQFLRSSSYTKVSSVGGVIKLSSSFKVPAESDQNDCLNTSGTGLLNQKNVGKPLTTDMNNIVKKQFNSNFKSSNRNLEITEQINKLIEGDGNFEIIIPHNKNTINHIPTSSKL